VLRAAGPARSKGRRWRWLAAGLLGCASIVGAGVGYQKAQAPQPPSFVTVPLTRGDLIETVTAIGTLAPVDAVELGAEVTGRLTRVLVDVNDEVVAGQVLAEIDPEQLAARARESRAQLSSATANRVSALASLGEAERKAERIRALHGEGIATGDENETAEAALERARANVGVASAQITVAQANLASAEALVQRAVIRAPIAGIVLSRSVEPGQTVTAGFQTPVLFTLARDLGKLELEVEVDEADIGKVHEGQTASFVVDAYPGRSFASKLLKLHNLPKADATIVTYSAVLAVDNQDRSLRPGMTATASIVTNALRDVLLVDNAALRFEPPRPPMARRRGFLPIPGLGGGPAPGRAERGRAPGNGPPQPPAGDRIFLRDELGALRRVTVTVLATDGSRSAISAQPGPGNAATHPAQVTEVAQATEAAVAAPGLDVGSSVVVDVAAGGES
jgi:HlyD family secretion protein